MAAGRYSHSGNQAREDFVRYIIAADHAGFGMKETIRYELRRTGIELTDAGTFSLESVDYPDYAAEVARRIISGEFDRGILVCGSGAGMSIVANKFAGIRAALCFNEEMAALSRQHNDSNVLVLPGRFVTAVTALRMVKAWMESIFEGGRHSGRLEKIRTIENR